MGKLTLATYVTLLRFVLVIILYPIAWQGNRIMFLFVFVLAGLTDVIDGLLARSRNERTHLGAKLDSLADYALYLSTIVWLSWLAPEVFTERIALLVLAVLIVVYGLLKVVLGKPFRHLVTSKIAAVAVYAFVVITLGWQFIPSTLYLLVFIVGVAVLRELRGTR
ncbi:MAG TPA: CDP-alcohol phosphatidyltransferase family protein [Candidatus Binatia bacterium]|nr:CDP-alcohol phosphatidyltransferase family protein [Candidatus Binatia bacterium]